MAYFSPFLKNMNLNIHQGHIPYISSENPCSELIRLRSEVNSNPNPFQTPRVPGDVLSFCRICRCKGSFGNQFHPGNNKCTLMLITCYGFCVFLIFQLQHAIILVTMSRAFSTKVRVTQTIFKTGRYKKYMVRQFAYINFSQRPIMLFCGYLSTLSQRNYCIDVDFPHRTTCVGYSTYNL